MTERSFPDHRTAALALLSELIGSPGNRAAFKHSVKTLRGYGLRPDGWEARDLAGHLASVAEYRDAKGGRVTLMRWRGDLPRMAKGTQGDELAAYTWGRHTSYWWESDGVVWCLVGTIDQDRLYEIAEHLGGESAEAELG